MSTANQGAVAMQPQGAVPNVASETAAIIQMIERAASNPAVDIDKMERLLQVREREMQRAAKVAYASAFSDMQSKLPAIPERGKGHGTIRYALWEDINDLIKPVMAEYGFGMSFRVGREGERLTITAVLMHREGHSEETTMELPADTSGSKNPVQAVGSSTSYGKRYTAQALLNLTSRDAAEVDDDGKSAGVGATITSEQVEQLQDLIIQAGADPVKFLKVANIARLEEMPAVDFDKAMSWLRQKMGAAR